MNMQLAIGIVFTLQALVYIQGYTSNYLGCFKDKKKPERALQPYIAYNNILQNSVIRCMQICAPLGFRYFGVQQNNLRFCGNYGYDRYGPAFECFYPCTADIYQFCGGYLQSSVYEIVYPSTTTITVNYTTSTTGTTTTTDPTKNSVTTTKGAMTPTKPNDGSTVPNDANKQQLGMEVVSGVAAFAECAAIVLVVVLVAHKCKRSKEEPQYESISPQAFGMVRRGQTYGSYGELSAGGMTGFRASTATGTDEVYSYVDSQQQNRSTTDDGNSEYIDFDTSTDHRISTGESPSVTAYDNHIYTSHPLQSSENPTGYVSTGSLYTVTSGDISSEP